MRGVGRGGGSRYGIRGVERNAVEKIQALFPCTYGLPRVEYEECANKVWRPVNIGVVLSGGQAP